jgi:hypothetical protein
MTLGTFSRTLYGMYPLFSPTDLLCSYMNWHLDWILGCYGGGSRHSHYPESDTIVLYCPARKSSSDVANDGGFHSHWEIIVSSWSRGLFCTHPLTMIKQIESLDLPKTNCAIDQWWTRCHQLKEKQYSPPMFHETRLDKQALVLIF